MFGLCLCLCLSVVVVAEERRLFVGMLCRDYTEEDLHLMFSTYGHVEDVSILRNAEGKSKGM